MAKILGVAHNEDEQAIIEWLKRHPQIKRTAGGTYKWLAAQKAAELGYVPKKMNERKKSANPKAGA